MQFVPTKISTCFQFHILEVLRFFFLKIKVIINLDDILMVLHNLSHYDYYFWKVFKSFIKADLELKLAKY